MTGPYPIRSRRDFLAASAVAAIGGLATVPRPAVPQTNAASPALSMLDDGVALISGAGGNIVVVEGAQGLVLIDTGSTEHASAVRSLLEAHFSGKPVETVINTHWHLDHTGGNDELAAGAESVIAHENTRLWMSTTFYVDWEDRRYFPRARAALPNKTFFSSDAQPLELDIGGERLVYAHLPQAHTDGDVFVHLPQRNLIVAGGTLSVERYPVIDYITGGWIGGLADAAQSLFDLANARTRIVPDRGAPAGRGELQAQVDMLQTVRERIEAIALEGRGVDEMIAARITAEFDARYGDPERFIKNAYQGMWWNRLRGIVA